ncbi:hypothetical protein RIF29_34476 [Crotalaria pallida]|uniref:Uncharacterized protein n=1 Tax=Crotalaria pallida TaxID=3830 RepID=A0AAN9HR94_CROPI
MMPTPGLRVSSSDGPRYSPVIGSSQGSQSMPIPNSPCEDLNEDALPDGLLPDLPLGWIMPTAKEFFPCKEASTNIRNTLKDVFHHLVTSYHQIEEEIRKNVFFERFRTLVKWDPAHEERGTCKSSLS